MSKIYILTGLPASGKTTWALEMVKQLKGQCTRVNKDDLRDMLHAGEFSKANEKQVLEVRDDIIHSALNANRSVIVDDTNLHPKHETAIRAIAKEYGAEVKVKYFDITPEEAIKRDLSRSKSVGSKVIMQMYNKFLKPDIDPYKPPEGKDKCIVVDIDGTLAHMNGRSPYEWNKVDTDELDIAVANLVDKYYHSNGRVILLSGRDSACKDITIEWLDSKNVCYDKIFMREMGDMRDDRIVKRELFEQNIKDNYQVEFVLDDRDKVVDMWRNELGLKVLQVAEGDF